MTILNYTVNGIDVAFVVILLLLAFFGWRKGIFVSVLGFIRWSVGTFLCFFLSNTYSLPVYNEFVKPRALEYITQKIVTSSNVDEILDNLTKTQESLPKLLADSVNLSSVKLSGENLAQSVLENVFEPTLIMLTKIYIFILAFVVFFGITGIIILAVKHHNRKKDRDGDSKLRKADKFSGMLFGLVKALVIIFAVSAIITYAAGYFEDSGTSNSFIEYSKGSALVEQINNINPFNAITEGLI